MMRSFDILTSALITYARNHAGSKVLSSGPRPAKPLELYDFESCPFCRKVREALSALDLDAVIYPCPKKGERFRSTARELGGKSQFPYFVDPNTGAALYESDAIVAYLARTYGGGEVPPSLRPGPLAPMSNFLGWLFRAHRGTFARPSRMPKKNLELWGYETSPFTRLVRERLCELELPYLSRAVAPGSAARPNFIALYGKMQVPFLVDPNTNTAIFESADIIKYLERTYAFHR